MLQKEQEQSIKEVLKEQLGKDYLFVKIHGSQFQMRGLPDFLILTPGMIFWLEHKRDKGDVPTKLQKYVVEKLLRKFNIFSGYIIDDFVFPDWGRWDILFRFDFLVKRFNSEVEIDV